MAQPDVTISVGDGVGSSCLTHGIEYTNCSNPVCYEAGSPCSVGDVDCYLFENSLCICDEGAGFELKNPCDQKRVVISVENLNDRIKGLFMRIRDVDDFLVLTRCETIGRAAPLACFSNEVINDPLNPQDNGTFKINLADVLDPVEFIEPGTGPIVRLTFQVSSAAPLGECRALNVEVATAADENLNSLVVATEDGEFCFNTPPLCVEVSPGSLMQGVTGEEITITGQNTNFLQGVNDVIFSNTGITVDSFIVDSDTQIRATISIAGNAPIGVGDVTVDAVAGGVDCVGAFEVLERVPTCVSVVPGSGMQGQTLQNVEITGSDTLFTQGSTPQVSFNTSGIIVNGVTVVHDELLRVDIFIPETVTPGFVSVTVTTAQGVIQCTNAFEVTEKVESCLGVVPGSGMQDSRNLQVVITGQYTSFAQGVTEVSFDNPDITLGGTIVDSATQVTVLIDIAGNASTGLGSVTVTTGAEEITCYNAFEVLLKVYEITEVRESNPTSASFTVSWITDGDTDGVVHYSTAPDLLDYESAYDDRGGSYLDDTHHVSIGNLEPETTYYYEVVSGGTIDNNSGLYYSFNTMKVPTEPPPNCPVYGFVYQEDGITPAEGTIVYLELIHGGEDSYWISALADANGIWVLNLGNLYSTVTDDVLPYSEGDIISLEFQGGSGRVYSDLYAVPAVCPLFTGWITLDRFIKVEMELHTGFNLIAFPFDPMTDENFDEISYTAFSLIGVVPECSEAFSWDASGQGWLIAIDIGGGVPGGDNFQVEPGKGYFLKCTSNTTSNFYGQEIGYPLSLTFEPGFNLIAVPYPQNYYTACSLINDLPGASRAFSWDPDSQRWLSALYWGGICAGNDFTIEKEKGYVTYSTAHIDGWVPGVGVGCSVDLDCDDSNICTDEVCVDGVCQYTDNANSCDDGLWCTENDVCSGGICLGAVRDCSAVAVDQCQYGFCDDTIDQCVAQNRTDGSACEDGLYCTTSDQCLGGVCAAGPARDCSATGDQCNYGICDDAIDQCLTQPQVDGTLCDDALFCTENDRCTGGVCGGAARDCFSAGDECNDGVCDDNSDQCVAQPKTDGTICDDGLWCTESEICSGGVCGGGTTRDCSAFGDECNDGVCDDGIDQCVAQSKTDGTACDDGLWCTVNDQCVSGGCTGGSARNCSWAGDQCNDGVCDDNADQCVAQPKTDGVLCDDGLWCSENDACVGGMCGGTARDCSAGGDECNDGVCDDGIDQCVTQPKTDGTICDDGLYCTQVDECQGGQCLGSGDPCPDDGLFCNGVEFCQEDILNFLCGSTGDPCPPLTCDELNDICTGSQVTLIIGNGYGYSTFDIELENTLDLVSEVHLDVCDADQRPWLQIDTSGCSTTTRTSDFSCAISDLGSSCVRVDLTTAVSGVITAGAGPIAQLVYTVDPNAPLSDTADLLPQNSDIKDDGAVSLSVTSKPGMIMECLDATHCNDNNVCTDEVCVDNMCQYTDNTSACDDGLWCTESEICSGGVCGGGTARDCSSVGDDCNDGVCIEALGQCLTQPKTDGTICDDGLWCTENDECSVGICGGTPRDCTTAGDACNDGVCNDTIDQCVAQPVVDGTACDNGLYCTVSDQCTGGVCTAGPARDCSSAGDACNDGVCDDNSDQCVAQPKTDGTICDDGLWCTLSDQCTGGVCGGTLRDCSSVGDQCNDGVCDDNLEQCVAQPKTDGTTCDDGLWCTLPDQCTGGVCWGTTRDCSSAGDQCNFGICNENMDQCVAQPKTNGTTCEDGLFCTVNDQCINGGCSAGSARDCAAAGDECNDGVCDDNLDQCIPQPKVDGTICDDLLWCTENDSCNSGVCGGTTRDCFAAGDQCNDGVCDDILDLCVAQPKLDGTACDDGIFCNGADTCSAGSCSVSSGDPCLGGLECDNTCQEITQTCYTPSGTACTDDGNACTDDQCDGAGTCVHPNNNASCDDGLYCTQIDQCQGSQCIGRDDPCMDNGDYCDGVEYCQEDIGNYLCGSTGDPCDLLLTCDDLNDVCDVSDITLIIADTFGSGIINIALDNNLDFVSEMHLDVCDVDQRAWLNIDTSSCSTTARSSDFSCAISDLGGGCVRVDLTTAVSGLIDPGTGTVAQLNYTLDVTAPPGESADLNPVNIDLRDELANPLTVTPVPGSILVPAPLHFTPVANTSTWMDLWGTFKLEGVDAEVGDEVGVFVGNDCFGGYKVDTTGWYGFLPVYGDDPLTPGKDGADPGDLLTIKIWDSSDGVEYTLTINDYTGPDPLTWTDGVTVQVDINVQGHFTPVAQTPTWMDLWGTFMIDLVDAEVGDEVGIFVGNDCFGAYKVDITGWYGFLPVYGDDPATPGKDGAYPGDLLTIKIWDNSAGVEYTLIINDYTGPDPLTWIDGDVVRVDIDATVILTHRDNNLQPVNEYICRVEPPDNSNRRNEIGLSDSPLANIEHMPQGLVLFEGGFEGSPWDVNWDDDIHS